MNYFDAYRAQLTQLQKDYNAKLSELQNGFQSYQAQMRQPATYPVPQPTPAPAAPANAPEQGVPPHIQQITALGEIKGTLEKILEKLSTPATETKPDVKPSKTTKDENTKA
jgi:hypothetical protein